MPIPQDFAAESLYAPEAWFVHDVLDIDAEAQRVLVSIDTERLGPLVEAQRQRPGHPRHFPGAIAIQVTGTLGQLHAIYVLGLRPSEGWAGFGTSIKRARFPNIGHIGPAVTAQCTATRVRHVRGIYHVTYDFLFKQGDAPIYESTQTSAWFRESSDVE